MELFALAATTNPACARRPRAAPSATIAAPLGVPGCEGALHVGDVDTEAGGKACGEDDAAATMAAPLVVPDCVFDGETDDHPYVADDPCYLVRWFEDNQLTLYLFEDEDVKVVSD